MNTKLKALFLPVAVPMVAALLGGCTYGDKTPPTPISMPAQNAVPVTSVAPPPTPVVVNPAPAPVVVSPAPAPVVVSPAPAPVVIAPAPTTTTPVVVAPSSGYPTVVNYAEGRYQLYGDAGSGYYWMWIPAGTTTAYAPPLPPAVPRGTNVVLTPAQRQVVYQEGRYELYGDATNGYYWAWIPSGVTPPAPPPPWRVSQQR